MLPILLEISISTCQIEKKLNFHCYLLFDTVIGINSMKAQGVDGISFAIPIDTASLIIKQLMATKKVVRPYIGLKMGTLIDKRRKDILNPESPKIVVVDVERGSPSQKAGIKT